MYFPKHVNSSVQERCIRQYIQKHSVLPRSDQTELALYFASHCLPPEVQVVAFARITFL